MTADRIDPDNADRHASLAELALTTARARHRDTGRSVGVILIEMDESGTITSSAGPAELRAQVEALSDIALRLIQMQSEHMEIMSAALEQADAAMRLAGGASDA